MRPFFKDPGFEFDTLLALGASPYQASDVGEVLVAIDGVRNGHHEDWVRQFTATAERVERESVVAADAGHHRSAALSALRAANYYACAQLHADGTDDPNLFSALYERHRAAWDRFCELWTPAIVAMSIPYELGETMDAWLFTAGGSDGPQRTLIFNNGSDGAVTAAWVQGVAEALARGWNAVTFDGPGQNSSLVRKQLFFRPDWEAVVTPVVDHLRTRPEVDPDKLALLGVSQGGYWVPRALAFEPRIAAGVADPGVMDVSRSFQKSLPGPMLELLERGDKASFDEGMQYGISHSPEAAYTLRFRFRPYGLDSFYDVYRRVQEFRLTPEVVSRIRCPVLVTDPDDEQFWPGDSQALHDALQGPKELVRFTRAEGANWHCEPVANLLRNQRIFDWLDEQVPA